MLPADWFLPKPVTAIVFDCDGTLSRIEGIDELARLNGVGEAVAKITAEAMGHTGINADLYKKRLDLVLPTQLQVSALAESYFAQRVMDLLTVLHILRLAGKTIYVVSAGLYPAVLGFAAKLGVMSSQVFAVSIQFDAKGHYQDFDHNSPLVTQEGKRWAVQQIQKQHRRLIYIGDGLNDMSTQTVATRFVGYGGAFYRENIAKACRYYIAQPSMLPLLAVSLTQVEALNLPSTEQVNYRNSLSYWQE